MNMLQALEEMKAERQEISSKKRLQIIIDKLKAAVDTGEQPTFSVGELCTIILALEYDIDMYD